MEISGWSGDLGTSGDKELCGDIPEDMECVSVRKLDEQGEDQHSVELATRRKREIDIREEQSSFMLVVVALWANFDPNYLRATTTNLLELSKDELDMVLMVATTHYGEGTSSNKKTERERIRKFTTFTHWGVKVSQFIMGKK